MKTLTAKLFASALLASAAAFAIVATPTHYAPALASVSTPHSNEGTALAQNNPTGNGFVTAEYKTPEGNSNDVTASYAKPEAGNTFANYEAPEGNNNDVVASYAKPEESFVVADIPGTDHAPSA
jgi:hypothetical protein